MKTSSIDQQLIPIDQLKSCSTRMAYDLFDPNSLAERAVDLQSQDFPRDFLCTTLHAYNSLIGNDSVALEQCQVLQNPNSTVVVTGQQAGLFTGPLYTVFKIATTIRLAKGQSAESGRPVIPVYWNATEDHDISEIASCHFPGTSLEAEFPTNGISGERLSTEPLISIIAEVTENSPDNVKDAINAILSCSTPHYGEYSSSVIARLFKGTGLVILEPRLLRPVSQSFFEKVLAKHSELIDALAIGADAVHARGIEPAFSPDQGTGLFYINKNGVRRQIRVLDTGYELDSETISHDELQALLTANPESFSTGAWLRPVLQSSVLPVLAYIAGPSEFKYHLQLNEVFDVLETPMPPIRLRNHGTILGPVELRLTEKLGIQPSDFFQGPEPFYTTPELPESYAELFSSSNSQLNDIAESLKAQLTPLGLERSIDGFLSKTAKDLSKLEARVGKELQRQAGVGNQRVDRLFQSVFPGHSPQERRINVFHFIRFYGPELITELIEAIDPDELSHYIFTPASLT